MYNRLKYNIVTKLKENNLISYFFLKLRVFTGAFERIT